MEKSPERELFHGDSKIGQFSSDKDPSPNEISASWKALSAGTLSQSLAPFILPPDNDREQKAAVSMISAASRASLQALSYIYDQKLRASEISFWIASLTASIGIVLFGFAAFSTYQGQDKNKALMNFASGTALQVVAGISLSLNKKILDLREKSEERLFLLQQILIANELCDGIEGDNKNLSKTELIKAITQIQHVPLKEKGKS